MSYELVIDGNKVVVDKGTFCYTPYPRKRREYVSLGSHNLPFFTGLSQNEYVDLFQRKEKAFPELLSFEETNDTIFFRGVQYGFGSGHIREITWHKKKKYLFVQDFFDEELVDKFEYNQIYSFNPVLNINSSGAVEKFDAEISNEYRVIQKGFKYHVNSRSYCIYG